jgi:hypothetical protein
LRYCHAAKLFSLDSRSFIGFSYDFPRAQAALTASATRCL